MTFSLEAARHAWVRYYGTSPETTVSQGTQKLCLLSSSGGDILPITNP
jgi:hypothetical protein